jgi:hypothetical protein
VNHFADSMFAEVIRYRRGPERSWSSRGSPSKLRSGTSLSRAQEVVARTPAEGPRVQAAVPVRVPPWPTLAVLHALVTIPSVPLLPEVVSATRRHPIHTSARTHSFEYIVFSSSFVPLTHSLAIFFVTSCAIFGTIVSGRGRTSYVWSRIGAGSMDLKAWLEYEGGGGFRGGSDALVFICPGGRLLGLLNDLLFARRVSVRSGFVQEMVRRGVSWSPRMWVVVTQLR